MGTMVENGRSGLSELMKHIDNGDILLAKVDLLGVTIDATGGNVDDIEIEWATGNVIIMGHIERFDVTMKVGVL